MKHVFSIQGAVAFLAILVITLQPARAQEMIKVSGTVTAYEDGTGLPGVTVQVKETGNGVATDFDGNYTIEAPATGTLVYSFVGFTTEQIAVSNRSTIDVAMMEDIQKLSEVVVVGYGTTTAKDATGSITSIKTEDFNQGNIVTPENLLNGRVAGLSITTGGEPGAGSTIRIRGGASLNASNDPLIVINGLPIDNNAVGGSRSILSSLNPNDIESFTVLKDASATAIYGSRASNGVIIITTKEAGKEFAVNLDVQAGVNTLTNTIDVLSADQYRQVVQERRPDLVDQLGSANTNWQEEIFQEGFDSKNLNLNLAVQGSLFDAVPARFSLGRSDQEGLTLTSKFERTTASLNLTPRLLDDHLRVSVNANYAIEENSFAGDQIGSAITFNPTQPVYDPESPFGGFFQYYELNDDGVLDRNDLLAGAQFNPVAELLQRDDLSTINRLYGNVKFDYSFHFLPELSAVVNLGLDDQESEGVKTATVDNPVSQPDGSMVGSRSEYTQNRRNTLFDSYLNYEKLFDELVVKATAGYSYQKFEYDAYDTGELFNDEPESEPTTTINTDLVLIGFFGRADFTYNDKYLLTLSARRDGTSRFSPDTRWGTFPAAAIGWQIDEEFFPNSTTLSTLKLRAGWGITGQQDIGDDLDIYQRKYISSLPNSQYQFGNVPYPVGLPTFRNEALKWEETTTYNLGLDFGILQDRFTGSVEAYYKESSDLLTRANIADGSNFSNAGIQNLGDLTVKGIEFAVNGDVIDIQDGFRWNVNFNATAFRTEIERLALNTDQIIGGLTAGTGSNIQIHRVGYSPYTFYVYKQVYDENGKPIEGAFADLNGDNTINDADRYLTRNNQPDFTLGFLSNMNYKAFDLSFNLRASVGNDIFNDVNASRAQYNNIQDLGILRNLQSQVLESDFVATPNVLFSDYYLEDGSFLRMDNITLGYTLRSLVVDRSSIRLSAGVQNVFVLTDYSGLDPEVFDNGIDNAITPRPRTFYVGANIKF